MDKIKISISEFKSFDNDKQKSDDVLSTLDLKNLSFLLIDSGIDYQVKITIANYIINKHFNTQPDDKEMLMFKHLSAERQASRDYIIDLSTRTLIILLVDKDTLADVVPYLYDELNVRITNLNNQSYDPMALPGLSGLSENDLKKINSFNWGAFLASGCWSLINKRGLWIAFFMAIGLLFRYSSSVTSIIALNVVWYAGALVLAKKANEFLWVKHKGYYKTVDNLIKSQRIYLFVGFFITLIEIAWTVGIIRALLSEM